jgi:hypothetical protein
MLACLAAWQLLPIVGWRGLFLVGLVPLVLVFMIRYWVPESADAQGAPRRSATVARLGADDQSVTTVDGSTATFTVPDGTRLLVACVQVQNQTAALETLRTTFIPPSSGDRTPSAT